MAKFEVIRVDAEKTVFKREQYLDKEGCTNIREFMEVVEVSPGAYGHEDIAVGDILEITDKHLASKARNNTEYFKEVTEGKAKKPNAKTAVPIDDRRFKPLMDKIKRKAKAA